MSQKWALSKMELNRTGKSLKKFIVQAQNQAACQIALQWHGVTKPSIYVWKSLILAIIILPENKSLPLCNMVHDWRTGGKTM